MVFIAYSKLKNLEKNAVIYARYSSENQREESIEGQVRECSELAARMGLTVVEIYADRALSGKYDDRPEFQRMIADSAKRQFAFVIVYKIDRFARNKADSAIYKTLLKKNGVKVLYSNENIPDTPEGIVLESVLEGFAEYFSANLAVNVRRGMKENALKCKTSGARPPLGFRKVDGFLQIDPETAPIVRMVFEMYAARKPTKSICRALKLAGYKTAAGDDFCSTSIRVILENEKYKGTFVFNADMKKGDVVRVEGGCPAIVEPALFDLVQKIRAGKKLKPRLDTGSHFYLLAGLVKCCGGGIYVGNAKQGSKYKYYRCERRHDHLDCSCGHYYLNCNRLDVPILDYISSVLLDPVNIAAISERAASLQVSTAPNVEPLKKRLSEIENSIKNIIAAIERGLFSPAMQNRLAELENEKAELDKSLALANLQTEPSLSAAEIGDFLRSFLAGDITDPDFQKALVRALVRSVTVYPDRAVVSFGAEGVELLEETFPL